MRPPGPTALVRRLGPFDAAAIVVSTVIGGGILFTPPQVAAIPRPTLYLAIWSGVLVVSGGAEALIRYTGFAVVLFSGVAVAALFVLRAREPHAPGTFSALGYPIAPAVFVVASLLIVLNVMYRDPRPSGAGVLIILAGVPLYLLFATRSQTRWRLPQP